MFIDFILFLKTNINSKPTENSRLAKPSIKKLFESSVKSLLDTPVKTV